MVFLIDIISLVIPAVITVILYMLYYKVFVKGYVKRIKQAYENGDYDKAERMKMNALRKQPLRMSRLLGDIKTGEFDRVKSTYENK